MESLVLSVVRAVKSLFTPGMLKLFVLCTLMTVATLLAFIGITTAAFTWLAAHMQDHFILSHLLPYIGSFGATIIAWFLFPGIMPVIVNFFDDRIARLIENHDYPNAVASYSPPFWGELLHDLRFSLMAVLLNIIVLPFYLLPGINLFLFYVLNGYLLGREFFVMVARRHLPIPEANALRKRYGRTVLVAGIGFVVLATIPVVNLFAPFWIIAVMVHLFHLCQPRQAIMKNSL
jgi:CysZ protein